MTADDISGRNSRTGTKSGKCCKKKGRIGMEAAKSAANEEMQENLYGYRGQAGNQYECGT